MKSSENKMWRKLFLKNMDFLVSLLLTALIYLINLVTKTKIIIDYTLFSSIFLGIFIVNFTIFAISKYLIDNYDSLKKENKDNVDAVFRTPMNTSFFGLLISLISVLINGYASVLFLPLVIFLLFYTIISSYFVFIFIYDLSTGRHKT